MPTQTGPPLDLSMFATGEHNWGAAMNANLQAINDAIGSVETEVNLPSGAANLVIATPDGAAGISALRALVPADVPQLPQSQIINLETDLSGITADIPTHTSELVNDSGFITVADIPAVPVLSVFGRSGNVIAVSGDYSFSQISGVASVAQIPPLPESQIINLTSDLALLASSISTVSASVPTKTSQLTNDSGFITLASIPAVPVASVFGRTGAVIAVNGDYSFSQISGVAAVGQIPSLPASQITSGVMALARGGTNADLSATGGASQVLRQSSAGAAISVGQLAFADLSGSISGAQVPSGVVNWDELANAAADLVLLNAGFNTTFQHTSAVTWKWTNTTPATVSLSQSSPIVVMAGQYWATGAASAEDGWYLQNQLANGLNAASNLVLTHIGTTGTRTFSVGDISQNIGLQLFSASATSVTITAITTGLNLSNSSGAITLQNTSGLALLGQGASQLNLLTSPVLTTGSGLALNIGGSGGNSSVTFLNTQTATAGQSQSMQIVLRGKYWDGSQGQQDSWNIQNLIANGTNGATTLQFVHSGTPGQASVVFPAGTAALPSVQFSGTFAATGLSAGSNGNYVALNSNAAAGGGVQFNAGGTNYGSLVCDNANGIILGTGSTSTGNAVTIVARAPNTAAMVGIQLGAANATSYANTAGAAIAVRIGNGIASGNGNLNWVPTSGSGTLVGLSISPFINQTGTATGSYTGLLVNVVETALLGTTNKLLDLQSGVTGGVSRFSVDNIGNLKQTNSVLATATVAQSSPMQTLSGQYWNGTVSAEDLWAVQNIIGTGTNGLSTLALTHTGSSGRASFQVPGNGFLSWAASAAGPSNPGNVNAGLAQSAGLTNNSLSLYTSNASGAILSLFNGGIVSYNFQSTGLTIGPKIISYNGETLAGLGTAYIRGTTSQKAETGADANVLTVTPAAAVGTYRLTIVLAVSAASSATLGWTATWTDSNGVAQAPTNITMFKSGTAAPALTFAAATNDNYYGEIVVDVNAAGTNIVIKTTFAGTSVAYKASAFIERIG